MASFSTGAVIAASGRWHLGIGDPDAIGWCIVGAYAIAVGLSVWALMSCVRGIRLLADVDGREAGNQRTLAWCWFVVVVVMLALGVNKQLDLQTWFLQTMRRRAYEGGWYGDRRRYQADVVSIALVVGAVGAAGLGYLMRRVLRRMAITIAGVAMLVTFVTVRAISFHYVDYVLAMGGRINVNVLLESSGILLIIASTIVWQREQPKHLLDAQALAAHARTDRIARPPAQVGTAPGTPS